MSLDLIAGKRPLLVVPGNHDYGRGGRGYVRSSRMGEHFTLEEMRAAGSHDGEVWNTYHLFDGLHTRWLVIGLEFAPRDDVMRWANRVIDSHRDRLVIIVTHAYL
jgi:hypothetical protein